MASYLEEELFGSEDSPDLPEYIIQNHGQQTNTKVNRSGSRKFGAMSPSSKKAFAGKDAQWYRSQVDRETGLVEKHFTHKLRQWERQFSKQPKVLSQRQQATRLECLRQLELRSQLLEVQLQEENASASRVLQELQTERVHLYGDPNFAAESGIHGTIDSNPNPKELMSEYSQNSSMSQEEYEHPIRKLFYNIPPQESQDPVVTGAVCLAALDKAMERQFKILFEREERSGKAFLAAYLQCILRVPTEKMSDDVQGMDQRIGSLIGAHTLGSVVFAFLRVYRGLYDGIALDQQSLYSSIAQLHDHHTDSLDKWVVQATADILTFLELFHQQLLYKWPTLQDFRTSEIALECIHRAFFRHIPELQSLYYSACSRRNQDQFVQKMNKLLSDHPNGGLLEEFNIPKKLWLHPEEFAGSPEERDEVTAHAYKRVIDYLSGISELPSPSEKAHQVVALCRITCQCVMDHFMARDEIAPAVAADDLLPILSFVVVKAFQSAPDQVKFLQAEVDFMDALMPEHMKNAEEGYCLATLSSVLSDLCADRNNTPYYATVIGFESLESINESLNRGESEADRRLQEAVDMTQLDTTLIDLGQEHILELGTSNLAQPLIN